MREGMDSMRLMNQTRGDGGVEALLKEPWVANVPLGEQAGVALPWFAEKSQPDVVNLPLGEAIERFFSVLRWRDTGHMTSDEELEYHLLKSALDTHILVYSKTSPNDLHCIAVTDEMLQREEEEKRERIARGLESPMPPPW